MSRADAYNIATYVTGGGLAGLTALASVVDPKHAVIYAAGMGAVLSIAGIVRIILNPTPTNTIQVFDRNTGSTVEMKTVAAPAAEPAPPPIYKQP